MYRMKLDFYIKEIDISIQKIDKSELNNFKKIIIRFLILNQLKKV